MNTARPDTSGMIVHQHAIRNTMGNKFLLSATALVKSAPNTRFAVIAEEKAQPAPFTVVVSIFYEKIPHNDQLNREDPQLHLQPSLCRL